jgi:hypothetical protein
MKRQNNRVYDSRQQTRERESVFEQEPGYEGGVHERVCLSRNLDMSLFECDTLAAAQEFACGVRPDHEFVATS